MPQDFNRRTGIEDAEGVDSNAATRASASEALTGLRLGSTSLTSLPVFVDVGSRKISSQIERDGVPIGTLPINKTVLDEAILTRPILQVKVVSQSVAPGTPVPVGTTVDLVMANPFTLPVGVIDGVHEQFRETPIREAFDRLVGTNPLVNRIVTHSVGGQLSNEDGAAVRQIFGDAGVDITDQPGSDLNAAVATLVALTTFGS